MFLGGPFTNIPGFLYEWYILRFVDVKVCYTHLILVKLDLPIIGVDNVVTVLYFVSDMEPHPFEFLDAEYVLNTFLVEPTFNRTKFYFIVSGCIPYIAIPQHTFSP